MCKFEMQIKNTNKFQCAVKFGSNGWAYLWSHNGLNDPCEDCKYKTKGVPIEVEKELKSNDFWEQSGKLITEKDWKFIESLEEK